MTEKILVLKDIYAQIATQPPLFLIKAIQNTIDLFLLALILFLCILLVQISVNLVFHKGKHLLKQGFCCVALCFICFTCFKPVAFTALKAHDIENIQISSFENESLIFKKSLQYYDKIDLLAAVNATAATRDISLFQATQMQKGNYYKILITLNTKKEISFLLTDKTMYCANSPDDGKVLRTIYGTERLYNLINTY